MNGENKLEKKMMYLNILNLCEEEELFKMRGFLQSSKLICTCILNEIEYNIQSGCPTVDFF